MEQSPIFECVMNAITSKQVNLPSSARIMSFDVSDKTAFRKENFFSLEEYMMKMDFLYQETESCIITETLLYREEDIDFPPQAKRTLSIIAMIIQIYNQNIFIVFEYFYPKLGCIKTFPNSILGK